MSKNYAELNKNNMVTNTIIVNNNFIAENNLIEYLDSNPAYIGGDYFEGKFYSPQPFASWSRDGKGNWIAPIAMPTNGEYSWNEKSQEWQVFIA